MQLQPTVHTVQFSAVHSTLHRSSALLVFRKKIDRTKLFILSCNASASKQKTKSFLRVNIYLQQALYYQTTDFMKINVNNMMLQLISKMRYLNWSLCSLRSSVTSLPKQAMMQLLKLHSFRSCNGTPNPGYIKGMC